MSKSISIPAWTFELAALGAIIVGGIVIGRFYGNWEAEQKHARQAGSPSEAVLQSPTEPRLPADPITPVVGTASTPSHVDAGLKSELDAAVRSEMAVKSATTASTSRAKRLSPVKESQQQESDGREANQARVTVLALTGDMAVLSIPEQRSGITTTRVVRVGDSIDGIGRVLELQAGQGTVQTTSGMIRIAP